MFNAAFSSLAEPRSCWLLNKDTGVKGKKNWLEIYWKNDNNLPCDVSIMPFLEMLWIQVCAEPLL